MTGEHSFLVDGGGTGALMRSHDWSTSPLGSPAFWPQSLRSIVGLILGSKFPMFVAWGPELGLLYNDAYAEILGAKHPHALGRRFQDIWAEIWPDILPMIDSALAGRASYHEDLPLVVRRRGFDEPAWFTFSYSPVRDERGAVAGMYCVVVETTGNVLTDRRLRESEARTRGVLDGMAEGFVLLDRDFRVVEINDEGMRLEERPRDEIVGRTHWEAWPSTEVSELGRLYQRAMIERVPVSLQHRYVWPDGREAWVDVRVYPTADGGLALFYRDVTERVRTETAVRESEARLSFLDRLGAETAPLADANAVLTTTTRLLGEHLNLSVCAYADMDEDEDGFTIRGDWAAPGSRSIVGRYRLAAFGKLAVKNLAAGLPLVVNDNLRELAPQEAASFQGIGIAATICMPLVKEGRLTALMAIHDRVPRVWTEAELGLLREVTARSWAHVERVAIVEELRSSEAQLRAVFDQAAAGFARTDLTGRFIGVNNRYCEIVGRSREELLSLRMQDLTHPDDLPTNLPLFEALERHAGSFDIEKRYRRPDGSTVWVRNSVSAVRENGDVQSTLAVSVDISDRKNAEMALQESESRFREIADAAPVLIWISDTTKACTWFNRPWLEFTGRTMEQEYGFGWADGVQPQDYDRCVAIYTEAFDWREPFRMDYQLRRHDGEWRIVDDCGVPRFADGGLFLGYIGACTDVTEARRVEQAVRELNDTLEQRVTERTAELEQAQESLRQAQKMEAVGQLTGGVAHDFNNLLTVIKSSTDLLKRPDLPEERRARYIGAISDTVDRAAKLTGQLLAFARRQALKPEVFDAAQSVRNLADMVGTLTGSRITVSLQLPDAPCFVRADPSQFDTALVNMAVNARDAMDGQGQITVAVRSTDTIPAVRSHPVQHGRFTAVSVTDTGSGISPENLERIFEPFFTTKMVGQGTGLGLSQVFGFAKQSGGDVTVDSRVGQGTTFTLFLRQVDALEERVAEPERPAVADGHGTWVLVVEDNMDVGTFATQTLAELGYGTHWAASAEEALAELARDPDRFDVVFSDVVMPGMGGVEFARLIRWEHAGLPVVLTSGYSHVLAQNGTDGFELLGKPYSVEELSRVLRRAAGLGRTRMTRQT